MFPDTDHVRDMQIELDQLIQIGVYNITKLLKNSETRISSGTPDNEDDFMMRNRSDRNQRNEISEEGSYIQDPGYDQRSSSLSARFKSAKSADLATRSKDNQSKISLQHGGSIINQLIEKGLISRSQLQQLQKELLAENKFSNSKNPKKKPR